jgi:hypothetical protein
MIAEESVVYGRCNWDNSNKSIKKHHSTNEYDQERENK